MSPTLSNNQQFRLNRINEIKDYFVAEIKERELTSKKLSKFSFLWSFWKVVRSDAERINLIEEGKEIGTNEVIKHDKIIDNSLKS